MQKAKDISKSAVGKENRPHDYFHQRPFWRPFGFRTYAAVLIGLVVASAWAYWSPSRWIYMNGPLSNHHANIACEECHRSGFAFVSDGACHTCHQKTIQVDSAFQAIHHPIEEHDVARCTFCHQEHEGDIALTAIKDLDCVRCHGDLPREKHRTISLFAAEGGDHSEFAVWRDPAPVDPGRLKFPHKLHMDLAGVLAGPPGELDSRKFLACKDCHETDAQGERMLPINHEKHCGTCHAHKIHALKNDDVPHAEPAEIRAFLFQYFNANPTETSATISLPARQPRPWLDESEVERSILARVKLEESNLYGGKKIEGYSRCDQCHHLVTGVTSEVAGLDPLPTIIPPGIPDRWFAHAEFSHASHDSSRLECDACHKLRSPGAAEVARVVDSASATDVLIPRMEDCTVCHTPGKDSHSCTLCHTFHPEPGEPRDPPPNHPPLSAALDRLPVAARIAQVEESRP